MPDERKPVTIPEICAYISAPLAVFAILWNLATWRFEERTRDAETKSQVSGQIAELWKTKVDILELRLKQVEASLDDCKGGKRVGCAPWAPVALLLGGVPFTPQDQVKLLWLQRLYRQQIQGVRQQLPKQWNVRSVKSADPVTGTTGTRLISPDGWGIPVPASIGTTSTSSSPRE